MKQLVMLAAAAAILGIVQGDPARAETVPVSPGEIDRTVVVSERCPTFSWTAAAPGTESYELAIWKLASDGPQDRPVLRRFIPGGALSWTPGRSDCLEKGSRFAWSVRSWHSGGAGEWSGPRLFATPSGPAESDAAQALAVLGQYLEAGGTLESLLGHQSLQTSASIDAEPMPVATAGAAGAAKQTPKAAESTEEPEDALAPTPAAPYDPALNYGFSSDMSGANSTSTVAVEGVFHSTTSEDTVGGFLGVAVPDTEYFDFVAPYLEWLSADEIGVLGFSANDSTDNWGVVGVGGEGSWGGRFLHSDAAGGVDNQVMMAGPDWAMDVRGDVRIWEGSISCPRHTVRVGAWCIHVQEQGPDTFEDSLKNCWDQGMLLCPLDAIMACDVLAPDGADCSMTTDTDDHTYRIFVGDLHPPEMWVAVDAFGVGVVQIGNSSAWTGEDAWVYAPYLQAGSDFRNYLGDHAKETPAHSFCCTMPR